MVQTARDATNDVETGTDAATDAGPDSGPDSGAIRALIDQALAEREAADGLSLIHI